MKRETFLFSVLAFFPLSAFARVVPALKTRAMKGFKVAAGEARSGQHFKMKGVTLNVLDVKISSKDTSGDLAVFEQNGFTPNGGPPLHIHLFQDEFFYIIEGKYLFQVGEDTYEMKSGDTIFLPRTIPHAFVQLTETGKVIVSYMPAGEMEDFFNVTNSWTSPPTTAEIKMAFEEHGMKVIGPPLKTPGTTLK